MTDEQPQGGPESGREHPAAKPGHLLREARERKRLSLQAVAEHLNLRAQVVDYLEQDRYERLPPLIFVKGYLRAYAKLVDEPEERIMAAFTQQGLEAAGRQPELPRDGARGAGSRLLPAMLLLAVLVVAALFWWRGEQRLPGQADAPIAGEPAAVAPLHDEDDVAARTLATRDGSSAERDTERAEPIAPATGNGGVQSTPESTPEEPTVSPPPQAAVAGHQAAAAARTDTTETTPPETAAEPEAVAEPERASEAEPGMAPEPAVDMLVIRVRGDAWMDVRDGNGERVLYGTVRGPELFRFDGPYPYRLTIGDASAVELEFRGQPVDLAPHTRGRVARLSLPAQR
ncbi:RodZ domain-containing protein [Alkalilimnicola sp. S0819]|uniref:RodZ domain-containing protein n=1 Tax=Alkalilimnicola sp. S0819 TaxID=2613922 RepID=UPI001261EA51|nr:RodZ domain-containing protein [Alkalilimnicola sp. S0819]KAB7628402.1 DUF4115 domain-containing protein [Alkalilimnicola sp. S0819]MPQ15305.1 DUF4115 domain-containing protein [Alkalilimnicola sp. S0819]